MHIADGILPVEISLTADVVAIGLVYAAGRKLEAEEIPRMGIFSAALFIISLIHFPLGATSIHLGLYGMAGLIFGLRAVPIIFVTLLFQTLIFQHGGLLAVGLNALFMSSGAVAAWAIWKIPKIPKQIKSFLCGFLGIIVPALLISLLFVLAQYGKGFAFLLTIYIPAAVLEGLLTVVIYNFFHKVKPELLK